MCQRKVSALSVEDFYFLGRVQLKIRGETSSAVQAPFASGKLF